MSILFMSVLASAIAPFLLFADEGLEAQQHDSVGAGVEIIWKWTTGGQSLGQMAVDSKGNVVLAGCHLLDGSNWNILVRKLNKRGEIVWSGNFGTDSLSESAMRCFVGNDQSILLYCTYTDPVVNWPRIRSGFVTKLSSQGDSLWSYHVDTTFLSEVTDVELICDNAFIAVGQHTIISEDSVASKVPAAMVVDKNGLLKWQKSFAPAPGRWNDSKFEQIVSHDRTRVRLSTATTRECVPVSYFLTPVIYAEPEIEPWGTGADTLRNQRQEFSYDTVYLFYWGEDAKGDTVYTRERFVAEHYFYELSLEGDSLATIRLSALSSPQSSYHWLYVQEEPNDVFLAHSNDKKLMLRVTGDGTSVLDTVFHDQNNMSQDLSFYHEPQINSYRSGYLLYPIYGRDKSVMYFPTVSDGFKQRRPILYDVGMHPGNFSYNPQLIVRGDRVYVLTQTRYRDNPAQGYTNMYCLRLRGF